MVDLLQDGEYWATCRERTRLAASANGYGPVFPQAKMTVVKRTKVGTNFH